MPDDSTTHSVAVLCAHREIEQKIYRMGYALENGDFELVGELLRHATFGADRLGRRIRKGKHEIRDQYTKTNITYPDHGRATRELYTKGSGFQSYSEPGGRRCRRTNPRGRIRR